MEGGFICLAIIAYRTYDPEGDGKTKLEHVQDMLLNCVYQKSLDFGLF